MSKFSNRQNRIKSDSRLSRAVERSRPRLAVENLEGRLLMSTYMVTTNADSGAGSLRDAISLANGHAGADSIQFNLPAGQTSIAVSSALPAITDALTIDATTQPGYAGKPVVELNGASAGSSSGLLVMSSNVTIKGFAINRFALDGIDFSNASATADISNITISNNFVGTDVTGEQSLGNGSVGINLFVNSAQSISGLLVSNNVIAGSGGAGLYLKNVNNVSFTGNFIGTDASGEESVDGSGVSFGNVGDGVSINGVSMNNVFGGTSAADRNVISNNQGNGIVISTNVDQTNTFEGNFIGTDAAGVAAMGNGADGFFAFTGGSIVTGNVISANNGNGVDLGDNTTVLSNFIGTDASGTANLGNAFDGVFIVGSNNVIGLPGEGNVIAYNGALGPQFGSGVDIGSFVGIDNAIRGNSIFGNSFIGIDLGADGVTPNSNNPADHQGANNLQNYPVLASASVASGSATINGSLSAAANSIYTIDFFSTDVADPSGHGQARTFLGSMQVTTDGSGQVSFSTNFSVPSGQFVFSATATDSSGNTSEFSADATAPSVTPGTTTSISLTSSQFSFGVPVTINLTVTANSGSGTPSGTVELFDGSNEVANLTLVNGSAQFIDTTLSVGSHSFSAIYSGDSTFTSSSSSASVQVVQDGTTLTLQSGGAVNFGQVVSLSTHLSTANSTPSAPTGFVTFFDGNNAIGTPQALDASGNAALSIVLAPGSHTITAHFSGDGNFLASSSASVSQTVNVEPTTATLSGGGVSNFGQPVAFSVAIAFADSEATMPTGFVSFIDGSTTLATVALDATGHASALLTPGVGSHSITAVYSGDGNFGRSVSNAVAQVVNPEPTTLALSASGTQTVTFTATLSFPDNESVRPTGTVTFLDGSTVLGTGSVDATGRAFFSTSTLSAGSHTITAQYSGDGNYAGSASAQFTEVISRTASSVGISSSSATANFGTAVTFTATVTPSSATGTVTFADGSNVLGTATVTAGKATFTTSTLSLGSHSITATYSGDATFAGSASAALAQVIKLAAPAATKTTLAASNNAVVLGQNVTFTATVASVPGIVPTGTVTFRDGSTLLGNATVSGGSASFTTPAFALGANSITATYSGDTNDQGSTSAAVSVFVNAPPSGSVSSGQTLSQNFWNKVNGLSLLLSFNGSIFSTSLGNWLASSFPNLFGAHSQYFNFTGASNLAVAIDVELASFFAPNAWVDMLSVALDVYATSTTLGGATAAAYGFQTSAGGLGGATVNVGQSGSAFGVANNSTQTVLDLLDDANNRSPNGVLFGGSNQARNQADNVFNSILKAGK